MNSTDEESIVLDANDTIFLVEDGHD